MKEDNPLLNILVAGITVAIVSFYSTSLDLYLLITGIIGFLLLVFAFLALFKSMVLQLECINEDCHSEINRDNSDLWGSNVDFMKMDSLEKRNYHSLINFSTGLMGYFLITVFILSIIVMLAKYMFN